MIFANLQFLFLPVLTKLCTGGPLVITGASPKNDVLVGLTSYGSCGVVEEKAFPVFTLESVLLWIGLRELFHASIQPHALQVHPSLQVQLSLQQLRHQTLLPVDLHQVQQSLPLLRLLLPHHNISQDQLPILWFL
jgi:hypothetical protein